jgi:hypothetical protein
MVALGHGDPHLVTFDGLLYDFQAVGEFVLVSDGADFTVQVRQARWTNTTRPVARIAALAMMIGGSRVGLYAGDAAPVHVDGVAQAPTADIALAGGGSIHLAFHNDYVFGWPSGMQLEATVIGDHIDLVVRAPSAGTHSFVGLLGNLDGDHTNDLALRDGTPLAQPVPANTLYSVFAPSWRITQQESLFDYPPGLGTVDFTDPSFPSDVLTAAMLSPQDYAAGVQACTAAGISLPGVLDSCVLDVGVTGDSTAAAAYAGMPAPAAANPLVQYANDFESGEDGLWQPAAIGQLPAGAPLGPNHFAGPFGGEPVTLTLSNLPAHQTVTVAFDLYVMGNWNGDEWDLDLSGAVTPLMSTSFSNLSAAQAYPSFLGTGFTHPPQTSATAVDVLSASGSGQIDAVYHQRFTFSQAADTLSLELVAPTLSNAIGASWGVDNFQVLLDAPDGAFTVTIDGTGLVQNGTAHYYKRVDQRGLTFDQARAAAASMTFMGLPGHLAIFENATYSQEFAFVHDNVYNVVGVIDRAIYWVGASRPQSTAPGTMGWSWLDGTAVPTTITSTWNIDFQEGQVAEGAGFFQLTSTQLWDYAMSNPTGLVGGYVVEFEAPQPGP